MSRGLIFPFGGAKQIWRDYATTLSSILHKPRKAEIRGWGSFVEDELNNLPPGPPGPRGPRGPQGIQGQKGDKGDVGNYYGLDLIGISDDIDDRPVSANEGDFWGLLDGENQTITLYVWTAGAWSSAGFPITAPTAFPTGNTIYVQTNGSNANAGTSWSTAVRSIERALEIAWGRSDPTLIKWAPEFHVETQGHLDMPENCVIKAVHRTVTLRPAVGYETRNVFRMGSGCFVEGVLGEDWQVDDLDDPTSGFLGSFLPGAVINRVPYMHKVAMRNTPTWGLTPPPLDRANANPLISTGGGVILADGSVCSQYSRFPNIMGWGATPVVHNGIGYCARKGGLINAVNAISMWAHRHFYALDGGQIILSGCATQFGDWSLHAKGSRQVVVPATPTAPTPDATAAAAIQAEAASNSTTVDDMWAALVSGGYTTGWTAADQTYTKADAALFIQSVAWAIQTGDVAPVQNFAKGLFDVVGDPVYDLAKQEAFEFSFADLSTRLQALSGVAGASDTAVANLTDAVLSTITSPTKRNEPSLITAIGHTWTANLAGVALTKIPPADAAGPITDSILEEEGGVVLASGQDTDQGSAMFVGGVEIDADYGLQGDGFVSPTRRLAIEAAILGSF
jgi:hypothetical protein